MAEKLKELFIGSDGKLRAIWRAGIYYVAGTFLFFPLMGWPIGLVAKSLHVGPGFTAGTIALAELRNFIVALICTTALAIYERRGVDSYGLAVNCAFSRQTLEGTAAGLIMAAVVALGMMALGGMQVKGLAGSGRTPHPVRAGMAGRKCLCRHCRGVVVQVVFPADSLEEHWLLAVRDCNSAHLCCGALFLQRRRESPGCGHAGLFKPTPQLQHVEDRYAVVCGRFSLRLRLHATLRHRNAEWRTASGWTATQRGLQRACVADGRCGRHGSKCVNVSRDRCSVALCLVALPCQLATSSIGAR